MIIIVSKNKVIENKKEEFIAVAKEMEKESKKEDGCISYGIYESVDDPDTLTFIEHWRDQKALDAHNNSVHFTTLVPKIREMRAVPSKAEFYKDI